MLYHVVALLLPCFMDRVLGGLPFVIINLEDILVASPDKGTHAAHLRAVLQILRENGLVLNRGKCEFFRSEVKFLGLRLPSDHWQRGSLPDQISAVAYFLRPATIKELQAFLGAVNFYRLFKPAAAEILLPLTAVSKGAKKGAELLERSPHGLPSYHNSSTAVSVPGITTGQP